MAMRGVLTRWPTVTAVGNDEGWRKFLEDMIATHELDLKSLKDRVDNEYGGARRQGGIPLKDLKPEKFESNKKSEQSFRQWSEDVMSWGRRLDPRIAEALTEAKNMPEWNETDFQNALQAKGIDNMAYNELNTNLNDMLRKLTKGDARDIVDATNTGGEAWKRLHERFHAKTVLGATSIASRLQEIKRPSSLNESYNLLAEIRGLIKEFERQSQEKLPTAIVKAAYMRVVPETYRKGMELQIDIDKTDPGAIEDKIMQFIRTQSTGPAGMDVGTLAEPVLGGINDGIRTGEHVQRTNMGNVADSVGYMGAGGIQSTRWMG